MLPGALVSNRRVQEVRVHIFCGPHPLDKSDQYVTTAVQLIDRFEGFVSAVESHVRAVRRNMNIGGYEMSWGRQSGSDG
jgi:hypothetical protein